MEAAAVVVRLARPDDSQQLKSTAREAYGKYGPRADAVRGGWAAGDIRQFRAQRPRGGDGGGADRAIVENLRTTLQRPATHSDT
jgi:hypothetical protein